MLFLTSVWFRLPSTENQIGGIIVNYDPREFGTRITNMRKELGKTQQEMADKLHTSLDNYRGIEKGRRNPSLDLLVTLSSVFNVTLDWLVLRRAILTDSQRI